MNIAPLFDLDAIEARPAKKPGRERNSSPLYPNTSSTNMSRNKRAEHHKQKDRDRSRRQYAQHKQWLDQMKQETGCLVCGETAPCTLDYHHVDPATKSFTVAGNHSRKRSTILAELAKCVLICANCHRKAHNGLIDMEEFMITET